MDNFKINQSRTSHKLVKKININTDLTKVHAGGESTRKLLVVIILVMKKNISDYIVKMSARVLNNEVLTREPSITKPTIYKEYEEVVELAKGSFGTVKLVKINSGTTDTPCRNNF